MAIRVISFGRKWEARPLCGAKCAGSLRPHYDYDWRDMFLIRLAAIVTYLALMLVFLSCLFIHHKGSVRDALHTPTPLSLSFCSVICVSTWAQIGWNSPYYPSRGVGGGCSLPMRFSCNYTWRPFIRTKKSSWTFLSTFHTGRCTGGRHTCHLRPPRCKYTRIQVRDLSDVNHLVIAVRQLR